MAGCEFVFHVAADYRLWAINGQELYQSNVEGTRTFLQAARDSGVRRVVYTSSVATMGFGNNGHLTDESSPVALVEHDRRLQAQQVHGGAVGDRSGARRSGCRDGESDDADWRTRHQADADRTDRRGLSEAQVSGLCRYRAEPGGCDRLRRGPPAGDGESKARRALHSGRRESHAEQILDKLAAITGLPSPKVQAAVCCCLCHRAWSTPWLRARC